MIEEKIVKKHGVAKIESILERIKDFDDCTFIAINQKEAAAIVYQTDIKPMTSDHLSGEGPKATRYKQFSELKTDLAHLDYWLVSLPLLKKEIECQKLRQQLALIELPNEGKKLKALKQKLAELSEIIEG